MRCPSRLPAWAVSRTRLVRPGFEHLSAYTWKEGCNDPIDGSRTDRADRAPDGTTRGAGTLGTWPVWLCDQGRRDHRLYRSVPFGFGCRNWCNAAVSHPD